MYSNKEFVEFIRTHKTDNSINIYFDIETFCYNKIDGKKSPSNYMNMMFSFAIAYFDYEDTFPQIARYPNFYYFIEDIKKACARKTNPNIISCKATINLIAHNNNKYDNHFLLQDLKYYYKNLQRKNLSLTQSLDNTFTTKIKELSKEDKKATILEKRVKSKINFEFDCFIHGIHFKTIDNYMKTNLSIKAIGKKLKDQNILNEKYLKTTMQYDKYDDDYYMTDDIAREYSLKIFNQLNDDELQYIDNDVIILSMCVMHFNDLFPSFDYDKITFSSNVLETYKINELAKFQLLNKFGDYKDNQQIKYTEYVIGNENLFDYLNTFYMGGLNFYNYNYLCQTVLDLFSIDLNSSFPAVMYNEKIPTYIISYKCFNNPKSTTIEYNDYYYLYRMTQDDFNHQILNKIQSRVLRQMLVKYYSKSSFVNINTSTINLINMFLGYKIESLNILSSIECECVEFGAREVIEKNYFIKTQGKLKNKIMMDSPTDYKILDEPNDILFSDEEIYLAKVYINGIYGIPALRPYFNLFKLIPESDEYENIHNGFKNTERNILFSIFVTSKAFYNLLLPLTYLTQKEIDENFIYCDTDSLYLKKKIENKIPTNLYDDIALGKWGYDHHHINKMYVLNHKKYLLLDESKKEPLTLKCAGIPLESFDMTLSFESFIEKQFHDGVIVKNQKSIFNKQETISIYNSETQIDKGNNYPQFYTNTLNEQKENLINLIREENKEELDNMMYIESSLGTFTNRDIFPITNQTDGLKNISRLIVDSRRMKYLIEEQN